MDVVGCALGMEGKLRGFESNMTNVPLEKELKLSVSPEMQAKFLPKSGDTEALFDRLCGAFRFAGFEIGRDRSVINRDRYFDTAPEASLQRIGHSVRIRSGDGDEVLTIKLAGTPNLGIFSRPEIEKKLSAKESEDFIHDGFADIVKTHFQVLGNALLVKVVEVETQRRECTITRQTESYKLCLDKSVFIEPGLAIRSPASVEVEVEAKSDAAVANIEKLRDQLRAVSPEFELGNLTKQTRGMEFAAEYKGGVWASLYRKAKRRPVLSSLVTIVGIVGSIASLVSLFK